MEKGLHWQGEGPAALFFPLHLIAFKSGVSHIQPSWFTLTSKPHFPLRKKGMYADSSVRLSSQDAIWPARPWHPENQPLKINAVCNYLDRQSYLQKYSAPKPPGYLSGHLSLACSQGPLPVICRQNGVTLLAAVRVTPLYALSEGRICPRAPKDISKALIYTYRQRPTGNCSMEIKSITLYN